MRRWWNALLARWQSPADNPWAPETDLAPPPPRTFTVAQPQRETRAPDTFTAGRRQRADGTARLFTGQRRQ